MTVNPTGMSAANLDQGLVPQWSMGDKLRKAREVTGMTAAEFGHEIGVSRQSVGMAERGETRPRRSTLMLWAMRTGVSLKWLLENEETPSPGGNGVSDEASTAPAREEWAPRDSNPKPAD